MSEMVERVARAICSARRHDDCICSRSVTNCAACDFGEMHFLQARAAIKAMMEPTEKMANAGSAELVNVLNKNRPPVRCWQAMLTAALEDD